MSSCALRIAERAGTSRGPGGLWIRTWRELHAAGEQMRGYHPHHIAFLVTFLCWYTCSSGFKEAFCSAVFVFHCLCVPLCLCSLVWSSSYFVMLR